MIHLPTLSEYDPAETSEGSLDPLGLYAISDALAVKLVPGVRERQTNPRFLTATAVSLAVCSAFDEDQVAADGVSPPWMVFEWHMLEGLIRTPGPKEGLPGRQKVERALKDNVHLSAARYLKNARTLGFHGIYRILARTIDIESAGQLGEWGHELLDIWESEQNLVGFHNAGSGPEKHGGSRSRTPSRRGWTKDMCLVRVGGMDGISSGSTWPSIVRARKRADFLPKP